MLMPHGVQDDMHRDRLTQKSGDEPMNARLLYSTGYNYVGLRVYRIMRSPI